MAQILLESYRLTTPSGVVSLDAGVELAESTHPLAELVAASAPLFAFEEGEREDVERAVAAWRGGGMPSGALSSYLHAAGVFAGRGPGTGDVSGPDSATDGAIALWDGTSGEALQDGPTIGTGADQVLQLDGSARLPAVDGSQLTNLPAGQDPAPGINAGEMVTADGSGGLQAAGARELADRFVFDKSIEAPAGSLFLGPSVRLSAVAERLGVTDRVQGINYLTVSQQYNASGSRIPEYLDLGAEFVGFDQPLSDLIIAAGAVFEFSTTPAQATFSALQNGITLNFDDAIDSFRVEVWEGADDTGPQVVDFEVGARPAGFSRVDWPTAYGFVEGLGYFTRYSTTDPGGLGLRGTDLGGGVLFPNINTHVQRITNIDIALAAIVPVIVPSSRIFARADVTRIFRYTGGTSEPFTMPEGSTLFDGWYVWISQQASSADARVTVTLTGADVFDDGVETTAQISRNRIGLLVWSASASRWSLIQFMEATASSTRPVLHSLRLVDIPARIDPAANLIGDHTLSIDLTYADAISDLQLGVQGTPVEVFTVGTLVNGPNVLAFNISGPEWSAIIAGDPSSISFQVAAIDNEGGQELSNVAAVERRAQTPDELFYFGQSAADDPATVDLGTLASIDANTDGPSFTFSVGPTTDSSFILLLAPADRDLTSLINLGLNVDVLSQYARVVDVRVIGGQQYNSYSFGPVNAGLTVNYRATIQEP